MKQDDKSWFNPKQQFADLLIFGNSSLIDWDAFEGSSGQAIKGGSDYDGDADNPTDWDDII